MIREFIQKTKMTKNFTEESHIIFDVGSHDCAESIEFYKEFPNSKIYTFVCKPNTLEICQKNIKSYSDRITLIEGYLCDYDGDISLGPINQQNTIKWTQCHRLDTLMNKYGILRVDILWINMPLYQKTQELLILTGLGKKLYYGMCIRTQCDYEELTKIIDKCYI